MDPRSVFGDVSVTDWVAPLCCALIEYKPHIEDKLSRERRYGDFCAGISRWRAECLGNQQPLEATATALFAVCQEFGIIEWLRSQGIGPGSPGVRTRGAVRIKGPAKVRSPRKAASAVPNFERLAQLYQVSQDNP